MTILDAIRSRFDDINAETRWVRSSSIVEGEYEIETIVFEYGTRRPPITITIRKHITT